LEDKNKGTCVHYLDMEKVSLEKGKTKKPQPRGGREGKVRKGGREGRNR